MELPIGSAVAQLADLLGATTVAAIGGVQETRAVQNWIDGERARSARARLRFALQLALMIASLATRDLARAWFHGSNPHLNDRSPVGLLRDEPLESIQVPLMVAVRAFVARSEST